MRDIYRWNPKESEYSASCQSNESEHVIKNFFHFLGCGRQTGICVAEMWHFLSEKAGI